MLEKTEKSYEELVKLEYPDDELKQEIFMWMMNDLGYKNFDQNKELLQKYDFNTDALNEFLQS